MRERGVSEPFMFVDSFPGEKGKVDEAKASLV